MSRSFSRQLSLKRDNSPVNKDGRIAVSSREARPDARSNLFVHDIDARADAVVCRAQKATTLNQIALAGNIPIGKLINELRNGAGQKAGDFNDSFEADNGAPGWIDESMVVETIDALPIIEAGDHPIEAVFEALNSLKKKQLLKLITPFKPAPLIDKASHKGFDAFTIEESADVMVTYFKKR